MGEISGIRPWITKNMRGECEMINQNGDISTHIIEGQHIQIDELMNMSEEEFDSFLDFIDSKIDKKLTKFAIWIYSNRERTIS